MPPNSFDYLLRQAIERLSGVHGSLAMAQERHRIPNEQKLTALSAKLRSAAEFVDRLTEEVEKSKKGTR